MCAHQTPQNHSVEYPYLLDAAHCDTSGVVVAEYARSPGTSTSGSLETPVTFRVAMLSFRSFIRDQARPCYIRVDMTGSAARLGGSPGPVLIFLASR